MDCLQNFSTSQIFHIFKIVKFSAVFNMTLREFDLIHTGLVLTLSLNVETEWILLHVWELHSRRQLVWKRVLALSVSVEKDF